MIELLVENGKDYRELLDLLPAEGYECSGEGGKGTYEMSDGTTAVYRIEVDVGLNDMEVYDVVQEATEGSVEAQTV